MAELNESVWCHNNRQLSQKNWFWANDNQFSRKNDFNNPNENPDKISQSGRSVNDGTNRAKHSINCILQSLHHSWFLLTELLKQNLHTLQWQSHSSVLSQWQTKSTHPNISFALPMLSHMLTSIIKHRGTIRYYHSHGNVRNNHSYLSNCFKWISCSSVSEVHCTMCTFFLSFIVYSTAAFLCPQYATIHLK